MPYLSIIRDYLPIILAGLVAVFTGLYWLNARRAFRLELDRVVLCFRLEESERTKIPESEINEITTKVIRDIDISASRKREFIRKMKENLKEDEMIQELTGHIAFFKTLKSKSLKNRLEGYEEKQRELASSLRNQLKKSKNRKKD